MRSHTVRNIGFRFLALFIASAILVACVGAQTGSTLGPASSESPAPAAEGRANGTVVDGATASLRTSDAPSPASAAPSASASIEPSATPSVFPVVTTPPGSLGMDALATGSLGGARHGSGVCFWIEQGTTREALVWPYGFAALDDPLRLVGPDGQDLARPGDHVELGGGALPGETPPRRQDDPCGLGKVFIVSEVGTVNGVDLGVREGSLRLVTREHGTSAFCSSSPQVGLMLVMSESSLRVQVLSSGDIRQATWPAGFKARSGNRTTIVDGSGKVVMTQGVEDPTVRARVTASGADVCGFGTSIYT
jgi:hypothetical protein